MKAIMGIKATLFPAEAVEGEREKIVMIPFSAETQGELFNGRTHINGTDTQHILPDGSMRLSARYILHGTDRDGNECRLFIENCGNSPDNCIPVIRTDSPRLAFLENIPLSSKVEAYEKGVIVRVFS
ncbi:MAG: hypothetical protein J6O50_17220 [Ruminiclostridium sp.]|nr:hypothetical protein [Ruminiclostridium sp.]